MYYYYIKSIDKIIPVIGASTSNKVSSSLKISVAFSIIANACSSLIRPSWKKWSFNKAKFGLVGSSFDQNSSSDGIFTFGGVISLFI